MPKRIKESEFPKRRNIDLLKQKKISHKDDREAKKLYRILNSLLYAPSKKSYERNFKKIFLSKASSQFCIVKLRKGFSKAKHVRFLETYLPQKDKDEVKEKPKLFSSENVNNEFIENYKKNMDKTFYKFIISPENPNVDNEALVKTLVKRMEKITGYNFNWISTVHTNTNHPHAHLLINGVDKNGRNVEFKNVFTTQTIRELSREICTEMIGNRTREEIEASLKKIPFSNRYCKLDDEIKANARVVANNENYPYSIECNNNTVLYQRLCHLEEMGIAKKNDNGWDLEKDWDNKLKNIGHFSSYLKARNNLLFTSPLNLKLFTNKSGTVNGKVTKIYKMNYEQSWDNAIVIENQKSKEAYFVPLYNTPNAKLLNRNVVCSQGEKGKYFRPKINVENISK